MRSIPINPLASPLDICPVRPYPPAWVGRLFEGAAVLHHDPTLMNGDPRSHSQGAFTLITGAVREPADASGDQLAAAVASLYGALGRALHREGRHAVRLWNFVPDIQRAVDGAADRYMAFNLGRFDAYRAWFGGPDAFRASVPTSSAVGVTDEAIWVHVLATDAPGVPIENPRQIPSYRYSRRYGVRPPCFARATRVGARLLIGGTASILGEQSRHRGDIEGQTRETIQNLEAVIAAAMPTARRAPLDALESLRVHVRDARDAKVVHAILEEVTRGHGGFEDVEFVEAALCRKELLVEIEGVAECPTPLR